MRRLVPLFLLALLLAPHQARAQNVNINCYSPGGSGINQWTPCPAGAATTNGSVKIATGNTFQTVLSAASRHSLTIQNNNASDACYLFIGGTQITSGTTTLSSNITVNGNTITAQQGSIVLAAGISYQRYFPYVPSDAIYATCATTADSLYVDMQ